MEKTALSFTNNFFVSMNILLKALFSHFLPQTSEEGHPGHHFKVTPSAPTCPKEIGLALSST